MSTQHQDPEINYFEPNRVRYTLWCMLYYAIAWYITYLAYRAFAGREIDVAFLLSTSLGLFIILLVGIFVWPGTAKRVMIVILDEVISGPSIWMNWSIQFNLKTLDVAKSSQRNVLQRILGYRLIVSTSGEKILLVERAFDKNQVAQILKIIGCADSKTT